MSYEELSGKEKREIELGLLERAKAYWIEFYPRTEANDLAKMRAYSKEGLVQGVTEHKVKHAWYAKQGYWEDGTTTLEAHKKTLLLQKVAFGKKISELQESYASQFEDIVNRAKAKKKEIEEIPSIIKEKYGIKRKELLSQFTLNLEKLYDTYIKNLDVKIEETYTEMIKDFERQKGVLITQVHTQMKKEHQGSKGRIETSIKNYGAELEAELTLLNAKENDDYRLKQYLEEVKKINKEINSLVVKEEEIPLEVETIEEEVDTDLNEFTIPALKQLADQKGLEYTRHIRKAELIELLEG